MGFEMEYRIGNRKVSKRQWERHLFHDEPRRIVREEMENTLRRIRCPKPGQTARVSFTETSKGFDLTIEGCCGELEELAERAVA